LSAPEAVHGAVRGFNWFSLDDRSIVPQDGGMLNFQICAAGSLVLLAGAASDAGIVVASRFNTGLAGWAPEGRTCALTNGGGYLRVQDVDAEWARAIAPVIFAGSWTKIGRVTFDVLPDNSAPMLYPVALRVRNSQGASSEVEIPLGTTPPGVWSRVSVNLDGAGAWIVPTDIRSAVTQFSLRADVNDNYLDVGTLEFNGLDNITLWSTCPADINNDTLVDDSDFVLFVAAYNLLDCADPAMPLGCPADLNFDGFVDDADFVVFVAAYNELLCP